MDNLYEFIEALAKEKGFKNITEFCRVAEIPRATMSELKSGRTKRLSAETLAKIATQLNVSLDYLHHGTRNCTVTAYTNGISAYTGNTMQDIEDQLSAKESGSYRIVFRGSGVVITVDSGYEPSDEQINGVIAIYDTARSSAKKAPTLSKKDERDIARTMELLMNQLTDDETLMFDGDPMSDEARATIFSAMQLGLEAAKIKNKERFTPKKFKKG